MQLKRDLPFIEIYALVICAIPLPALADGAAEMQKKLQNPLASIKMISADNSIATDTGTTGETSYGFSLQGLYAIDVPDKKFSFLPRVVVPVLGLEPGTDVPPVGQPSPDEEKSVWGVGDSVVQFLFAPYTDGAWKWGGGPTLSVPTATDKQLEGPQWGAGLAGVLVGNFTEKLAFAGIVANQWGDNGNFNTMTLQPMFYYSLAPAKSLAYNAVISADWEASSSNRWTVPLGLSYNQTWDVGGGHGFDFIIGPYYNVIRPDGGPKWQLRFGLTWLFP